jgi:hypothetical protein
VAEERPAELARPVRKGTEQMKLGAADMWQGISTSEQALKGGRDHTVPSSWECRQRCDMGTCGGSQ